jgi:hypothetical protein
MGRPAPWPQAAQAAAPPPECAAMRIPHPAGALPPTAPPPCTPSPPQVRLSHASKVRNCVIYAQKLFEEKGLRTISITAMGKAAGKAESVGELPALHPPPHLLPPSSGVAPEAGRPACALRCTCRSRAPAARMRLCRLVRHPQSRTQQATRCSLPSPPPPSILAADVLRHRIAGLHLVSSTDTADVTDVYDPKDDTQGLDRCEHCQLPPSASLVGTQQCPRLCSSCAAHLLMAVHLRVGSCFCIGRL